MSVGGIDLFHSLYRPLLFDTLHAEPGDAEDMERLLAEHGARSRRVIIEPLVQGAAGMLVHPEGYLRAVRELCDRHGVLLIPDEVATGFGRTGRMFACEHEERRARPDVPRQGHHRRLPAARGDARPASASSRASSGRFEEFRTFFHGHTYTGNPLACAAALATLDVFDEERTLDRLQRKIELARSSCSSRSPRTPSVGEVRRRGFMVGIELAGQPARRPHRATRSRSRRAAAGP